MIYAYSLWCHTICTWTKRFYTCGTEAADNSCFASGHCVVEPLCPGANGMTPQAVRVNHVNDNPGFYTCGTEAADNSCFASGNCVVEPLCPGVNGQSTQAVRVNHVNDNPGFYTC